MSDSKQERIVQAIKDEVARVPYEDFSIGSVIRACGISRGSFYQYFRNKEDVFYFLISDYQKQIVEDMALRAENVLFLETPDPFHQRMLSREGALEELRGILLRRTGREVEVRVTAGEAGQRLLDIPLEEEIAGAIGIPLEAYTEEPEDAGWNYEENDSES